MADHFLSAEPIHSRWNRDLPPRLTIASGDTVHLECLDASGAQVRPGMTLDGYIDINRERIHALTGPIFVEGAEPGDVLQIDVLEVAHKGWGWTSVIAGLGLLKHRFADPYLFHWTLEPEVSRSLAPAIVPLRPFCGVMGVAPAERGEFRTIPPARSAGIWTSANSVPEPLFTCQCSMKARFFPPATLTQPKAMVKCASTASSARRMLRCGFDCTINARCVGLLSKRPREMQPKKPKRGS
jgi:hypothetical protein